jgi:hypothetical protein
MAALDADKYLDNVDAGAATEAALRAPESAVSAACR